MSSCDIPWGGSIADGANITAYQAASAPSCSSEERLCSNGVLSGSFANQNCTVTAPACPTGFIAVPGNATFSTADFCAAQYEMTYTDADSPNSPVLGQDWNTVVYDSNKVPVSQAGKYPIGNISQTQAIAACASMGAGYHLITNNQWMTIARNIEANPLNWSGGTVGV